MEDKDLDKYFKDRSGAFNEAPGEGLWAKIEANIEPAAPTGSKAGKWLLPGAGIVILTGLVAAWLVTGNGTGQQAPAPKQQEISVIKDTILPVIKDTVTYRDAEEIITEIKAAATPVHTGEPQQQVETAARVKAETPEIANELAANEPVTAVAGTVNTDSAPKPAAAVKDSVTAPFTSKGKDMIEIVVTQKITRAERNTLIKSTVEKNAPYVGRKIVIKAKGYAIFRHTITETDYRKYLHTLQDTLPTPKKLRTVVLIDTVYYDLKQDSLKQPNLKFDIQPKVNKKE